MHFLGHAYRSLDSKGRLILPQDFKDIIHEYSADGSVVLTLYQNHVIGMTVPQWDATVKALMKIRNPSRAMEDTMRRLLGGYEKIALDGQGRLPLSSHTRKSGRLKKDVVVFGSIHRFEIWPTDEYEQLQAGDADISQELADNNATLPFVGGFYAD
ncbi:MAG: division/cell wall cluster transcriptional repressor MraZ [Desulfovibrio sp.]